MMKLEFAEMFVQKRGYMDDLKKLRRSDSL